MYIFMFGTENKFKLKKKTLYIYKYNMFYHNKLLRLYYKMADSKPTFYEKFMFFLLNIICL